MAKFRTVDPKIWQHPALRRQPWHVRHIYMYLITSLADDEGRCIADAYSILEGAFARHDPVTEADVEAALVELSSGGHPLVLLYEHSGIRYGFLRGWYEHQYIRRGRRDPSALPPPPTPVQTWDIADGIRARYAKDTKTDEAKAQYKTALRWHQQLEYGADSEDDSDIDDSAEDAAVLPKRRRNADETAPKRRRNGTETARSAAESDENGAFCCPEVEGEVEGEVLQRLGHAPAEADAPPAPPPEPDALPALLPPEPKPQRADTPEQACIRRAWEAHGQTSTPSGKGYSGLMKLVREHGIPAVDGWIEHLHTTPPTVPEGADPWAWFCRQFRDALKRPWEWQKRDPPQRGRGMKPVSDWANTVIERNPDGTVKM
jgi:hypothetical protein